MLDRELVKDLARGLVEEVVDGLRLEPLGAVGPMCSVGAIRAARETICSSKVPGNVIPDSCRIIVVSAVAAHEITRAEL